MNEFTWIETYKEIATKLMEYSGSQQELIEVLTKLKNRGLSTISLIDKDSEGREIPLSVIDPFTFFANFNRGIKTETRLEIIKNLIDIWNLTSEVPIDFLGTPVVNNQQAWFFAYKKDRGEEDVNLLWDLFSQALDNKINERTFNDVLSIKYIKYNITMGLFWVNPKKYLNLDRVNRAYLAEKGLDIQGVPDFQTYIRYMDETRNLLQKPFYEISHDAWLESNKIVTPPLRSTARYWLFAPGRGGEHWEEFYSQEIMAIGWDYLGDLRQYSSKEYIGNVMREHDNEPESSKKNNVISCFSFCNEMQIGDIVFAKIGRDRIVGRGIISSDYVFDTSRAYFKHIRKVDWTHKGHWTVSDDNRFALKTITGVTKFSDFTKYLDSLVEESNTDDAPNEKLVQYWWLNANPKIWSIDSSKIGEIQSYTSYNEKGNKRRVYQYFQQVQAGDLVIGYESTPEQQVKAVFEITEPLHEVKELGEIITFKMIEKVHNPIDWDDLKSIPGLEGCEVIINNQGSLFKLKANEYEIIRDIIDDRNIAYTEEIKRTTTQPYSMEIALKELFLDDIELKKALDALVYKKNIVIQGPPGVGKTFIAKKLAYLLMGLKDESKIKMVQFHQSYSYEDFIQGIRPDGERFKVKNGIFYEFCKEAEKDPNNKYFLAIIYCHTKMIMS